MNEISYLMHENDIVSVGGVTLPPTTLAVLGLHRDLATERQISSRAIAMTKGLFEFAKKTNNPTATNKSKSL